MIVAFRSAKGRSFAERKTTIRRLLLSYFLSSLAGRPESVASRRDSVIPKEMV